MGRRDRRERVKVGRHATRRSRRRSPRAAPRSPCSRKARVRAPRPGLAKVDSHHPWTAWTAARGPPPGRCVAPFPGPPARARMKRKRQESVRPALTRSFPHSITLPDPICQLGKRSGRGEAWRGPRRPEGRQAPLPRGEVERFECPRRVCPPRTPRPRSPAPPRRGPKSVQPPRQAVCEGLG